MTHEAVDVHARSNLDSSVARDVMLSLDVASDPRYSNYSDSNDITLGGPPDQTDDTVTIPLVSQLPVTRARFESDLQLSQPGHRTCRHSK
jgi:hypothetical protein